MTPVEILRAARILITNPVRFRAGGPAYTEAGWITRPSDPNAVRWSGVGAIAHVNGGVMDEKARQAFLDAVYEVLPRDALACHLDHALSLAALDRAILKVPSSPCPQSRSVLARAEERRRANPPLFDGHAVWSRVSPQLQAAIGALVLEYAAAFNAIDGTSLSEARLRVAQDDLFEAILEAVPIVEWRDEDGRVRVPSSFGGRP